MNHAWSPQTIMNCKKINNAERYEFGIIRKQNHHVMIIL